MPVRHLVSVGSLCLLAACSSSSSPPSQPGASDDLLAPPLEGAGVQLEMVSTIAPGSEIERCKFYQVPAAGLNVNSAQVRYVAGSHHVLLFRTEYTSIPTMTRRGAVAPVPDANGVFDCADGAAADWEVSGVVAGAQTAKANDAANFPPGVAAKLAPGTVLVINTHYLNTSSKPLVADARINLYSIADKDVMFEGGELFFYNPFILVHAQSSATARMSCPITSDIKLLNGQSHMHRRGHDYVAKLGSGGDPFYVSHSWEDVPVDVWSPGMDLVAGDSIDYTCSYQNSEAREIAQGLTTKDEMCMFVGSYYPRNRELEDCPLFTPGKGATFIGSGAVDGGGTLDCMKTAADADPSVVQSSYYGCVVDSCPTIAPPLTSYIKCQFASSSAGATCADACSGSNPSGCKGCLLVACGGEIATLSAATCN
jgi:hypothetical protein